MPLKRNMGFGGLVFYGAGTILGAGIFVVIGEVMGHAGPLAPFAYALAGLVAMFTALSFAEMGARVPTAAGGIDYVEKAFGSRFALPATVGWLLILANTISSATITTGFVSYLASFVDVPSWIATVGIIAIVGAVAIAGMKQAAWFMTATTLLGLATIITIIWLAREGLFTWLADFSSGAIFEERGPSAFRSILAGAFLAIYSFIGFGDMAQTAEEVKNPKRNLPRGIITTMVIVFTCYLLVAMTLGGLRDIEAIANADAPLVFAATRDTSFPALPLALASVLVIVNGALTQIMAASRLMMDLGRDHRGGMPGRLGEVSEITNTPVASTLVVLCVVLALALFIPLGTLASGTSLVILMVFALVNAALWRLKRQSQPEDVPDMWIGVPVIGLALCVLTIIGQVLLWIAGG